MSSFVDEIIKQNQQASTQEPPQETQEQPQETVPAETHTETPPEQKTAPEAPETQKEDKPAEPPVETPAPEDKQEPPKARPDLSTLTKEEKAQHAFQRQLAKQRDKYENSIKELAGSFQKQFDELKETINKKPAEKKVLTRDQFETDDDFIRALADEKVNDIMGARDAKAREEAEAKSKADAEEAELRKQREEQAAMFNNTCKACFADEKYYGEFSGRVEKAVKNGFGELLDQAPAVRDFIFSQPSGPKVLDAMLKDRNTFVRVMGAAGNPTLATIEMYELAKELDKPAEQPQQQAAPVEQPAPKGMPHIGKPGARGGTSRTTFKSDNDIINFVRNCR